MRTVSQRIPSKATTGYEPLRLLLEEFEVNLRVSIPGIIESFDPATQTVTVTLALKEKLSSVSGEVKDVVIPTLLDVPIVLPRAGDFLLSMPIKKGDECLVVFSDMCIDAWFTSGKVSPQMEKRRHDLSDAFAIIGTWSQPNVVPNYSTTATELRNKSRTSYISLDNDSIDLVSPTIRINGVPV